MNDSGPPARSSALPRTVIALGVTSFFTDVGSEMIFPLLPVFLSALGATPTFLGLVEGLAEATASALKLASGYLSDRMPRKKPLVWLGYGLAGSVRPMMGLATLPWHVLAVRVTDRVGKGLRTAPRDVLIASSVGKHQAGRAFGLHRAMDHAGAVLGPFIATGLLALGLSTSQVFLSAAVPGALALLALAAVRERPTARVAAPPVAAPPVAAPPIAEPPETAPRDTGRPALSRAFYGYLVILAVFSLGASSDAFLLLRAKELGVSTPLIPTLWGMLHVSKLLSSYYGGALADRIPRVRMMIAGFAIYALSYLGLGQASESWQVWALFAFYGLYYGMTEPTERAIIKDVAPQAVQGRAFGLYHFTVGVTAIPASLLTGYVWQRVSPQAALSIGAALAAVSGVALVWWSPRLTRASA